jgi:O-antigen ligase
MPQARRLEWLIAVAALFLLTDVADNTLHDLSPAHPLLARAILAPWFIAAALVLWRAGRAAMAVSRAAWPALLLVAFAMASWTWSTDPAVTATWLIGLVGTTCVGLMLAVRFDRDEQLMALTMALGLVVALSAVVMLAWPAAGTRVTFHGPTWAAVFEDNNLFGRIMGLAALAHFVLALQRPDRRAIAVLGCIASVVLLLGSRSLSAQCVTGACLFAVGLAHHRERGAALSGVGRFVVAALVVVIGVGVLIQSRVREVAVAVPPLSGRVALWDATLSLAAERPLLGHGYATFWPRTQREPRPPSVEQWPPRHPHNGFMQLFFDLGALGVLAFVLPYMWLLRRAVRLSQLWPIAFLIFLFLSNLTETGLLGHKIFWALYVAVAAPLASPGRDPTQNP